MNTVGDLINQLERHLVNRSEETKAINSLMRKINDAKYPTVSGEVNPLDCADLVIVKALNPSIEFIKAGGRLKMSEDHKAHRHEYTIRLIVDFSKE